MKANADKLVFSLAVVLSLWVVFAGAYLCYASPHDPWRYMAAIAIICIAWVIRHVFRRAAQASPACTLAERKATQSIMLAGLLLGMALAARLGWIDGLGDVGERLRGFTAGAVVVFFANTIPKQTNPIRGFALRRAIGWALVLGGTGYSSVWLLLPVAWANVAAVSILLVAMAYVTARIVWFAHKNPVKQSSCLAREEQ
jgi:hypothetical protein